MSGTAASWHWLAPPQAAGRRPAAAVSVSLGRRGRGRIWGYERVLPPRAAPVVRTDDRQDPLQLIGALRGRAVERDDQRAAGQLLDLPVAEPPAGGADEGHLQVRTAGQPGTTAVGRTDEGTAREERALARVSGFIGAEVPGAHAVQQQTAVGQTRQPMMGEHVPPRLGDHRPPEGPSLPAVLRASHPDDPVVGLVVVRADLVGDHQIAVGRALDRRPRPVGRTGATGHDNFVDDLDR